MDEASKARQEMQSTDNTADYSYSSPAKSEKSMLSEFTDTLSPQQSPPRHRARTGRSPTSPEPGLLAKEPEAEMEGGSRARNRVCTPGTSTDAHTARDQKEDKLQLKEKIGAM